MKEHDCVYRHRALPPRDCGHRSGTETRKAAGVESGGWRKAAWFGSGFDRIGPLAVLALGGCDLQAHFLAQGAADKSAHRMRLPTGRLHDLLQRGAARSLHQAEDRLGFAALADALLRGSFQARGLGLRGSLGGALCAFFAGLAFFPDLPFLGATWAERAPARAFLVAFGSGVAVAVAAPVSSVVSVVM